MFILADSAKLPATEEPDWGGGLCFLSSNGDVDDLGDYAPMTVAIVAPENVQTVTIPVTNTPQTNSQGQQTLTIPFDGYASTITLPGYPTYNLAADLTSPQSGEFVYGSGGVVLSLRSGESPPVGIPAQVDQLTGERPGGSGAPAPTLTPALPVPQLYIDWNIEEATFGRSFQGHPTCSLKLTVEGEAARDAVLTAFENRTKFQLYDMGFEVQEVDYVEADREESPQGLFTFTINASGSHAYPLAQPFRVIDVLPGRTTNGLNQLVPIQDFATLAGLKYGGSEMTVRVARETTTQTENTLESLLQEYAPMADSFLYYSNANQVEGRKFGQTEIHYLAPSDLIAEISVKYPGKEMHYQGVRLSQVYKNSVLNLQLPEESTEASCQIKQYYSPPEDPSVPPDDVTNLKEAGKAHDNGGPTKCQTYTTEYNGTVITQTEVTYGFCFRLIDVYDYAEITPPVTQDNSDPNNGTNTATTPDPVPTYLYDESVNPADYWKPIKEVTRTWKYDGNGYLIGIIDSGDRLARLQQENNRETLELDQKKANLNKQIAQATGDELDSLNKELVRIDNALDSYSFTLTLATRKTTENTLADMRALYPDLMKSGTETNPDPNDVPPLYCQSEITREFSTYTAPDPLSKDSDPRPPIVTGKLFTEKKITTVTGTVPGKEAFHITTSTENSEGTGLHYGARQSNTEYHDGRVTPHKRANLAMALSVPTTPLLPGVLPDYRYKYTLSVEGSDYPKTGIEQGSKGYATDQPEVGRLAAECELAIANTQNSEIVEIMTAYNPYYREGNILQHFNGKRYVIFNQGWTEKPDGGKNTCEGMSLTLGRLLRVPVNLTQTPLHP